MFRKPDSNILTKIKLIATQSFKKLANLAEFEYKILIHKAFYVILSMCVYNIKNGFVETKGLCSQIGLIK